jgi:hypothetical protein
MKTTVAIIVLFGSAFISNAGESKAGEREYAKVYCKSPTTRFENGSVANPDSGIGKYAEIPEKYSRWKVTFAKDDKDEPLKFKVKEAGIVAVITLDSANRYLKSDGWNEVGTAKVEWPVKPNNVTGKIKIYKIIIFEKYLDLGEHELKSDEIFFGPPRLLKKR